MDGQEIVLFTQKYARLGQLFGRRVFPCDPRTGSLPLETVLSSTTELSLKKADPVTVAYAGKQISGLNAAETVGEALAEIGIPLQNLDYMPSRRKNEPLPADGTIHIVQVREKNPIGKRNCLSEHLRGRPQC